MCHTYVHKVTFITLKSGLVPFVAGVCSSNLCGFEICVIRHILHVTYDVHNMLHTQMLHVYCVTYVTVV